MQDTHTFTINSTELGYIQVGLRREADQQRIEYRRCHRRNVHPSVLGDFLRNRQTILDLSARLQGEQPAVVTATREQVAHMFADLEAQGFDMLGYTDAEVVRSWTIHERIRERRAS